MKDPSGAGQSPELGPKVPAVPGPGWGRSHPGAQSRSCFSGASWAPPQPRARRRGVNRWVVWVSVRPPGPVFALCRWLGRPGLGPAARRNTQRGAFCAHPGVCTDPNPQQEVLVLFAALSASTQPEMFGVWGSLPGTKQSKLLRPVLQGQAPGTRRRLQAPPRRPAGQEVPPQSLRDHPLQVLVSQKGGGGAGDHPALTSRVAGRFLGEDSFLEQTDGAVVST